MFRDGRVTSGEIFLNPISRHRVAPQQPAEFLNQSEPYFVLAPTYDERVLIAKHAVAMVEAPLPSEDEDLDTSRISAGVEFELTGLSLTAIGWLFYRATEGNARVQDYLNDFKDQFIVLFDSEKTTLVNRHAIASVRETA
jgi:sRNA-binding regulator protein Hfq